MRMTTVSEANRSATTAVTVVADQALEELHRLVSSAIEQKTHGNPLAASSSLVALTSVAEPLINHLRELWLMQGASATEEVNPNAGIYLWPMQA